MRKSKIYTAISDEKALIQWHLSYEMHQGTPYFSIFGKKYSGRFKDTDLFQKIFTAKLSEAVANGFLDTESIFVDGTHIKVSAILQKYRKEVIHKEVTERKGKRTGNDHAEGQYHQS